jgi:DNA-binding response OmpR family regulator
MEKKAKILYVEDDVTLSYVTRDNLEIKGYSVDFCEDGITALEMMKASLYDLCILDVMLPKMDGFTLAGKIRERNSGIPILFLTARSTKEDRITGFQLGGDDYITKPFSIEELVLKIEVFLKRRNIIPVNNNILSPARLGRLTFDSFNQQLSDGKKVHSLTQRENELLSLFAANPGQIIKREEILRKVWGSDHFFASRSLDVFISRLRKILKTDPLIRIENIHNTGYRLKIE